jgi:hypothetical protein
MQSHFSSLAILRPRVRDERQIHQESDGHESSLERRRFARELPDETAPTGHALGFGPGQQWVRRLERWLVDWPKLEQWRPFVIHRHSKYLVTLAVLTHEELQLPDRSQPQVGLASRYDLFRAKKRARAPSPTLTSLTRSDRAAQRRG